MGALAQTVRDAGLGPAHHYTFLVIFGFTLKRMFISYSE